VERGISVRGLTSSLRGSIEIVLIDGDAGKIRMINASYGEAPINYAEELMKNLYQENKAKNVVAGRWVLVGQTPRPRYILRAAPLHIKKYGAKDCGRKLVYKKNLMDSLRQRGGITM
jgi:hypothetical protein